MDRRDILQLTGTLAIGAVASTAARADHQHDSPTDELQHEALHCVRAADACLAHCFERLATGDASLALCAKSVAQVRDVCGTLATLAAFHSPFLARYAAVAGDMCRACETECRKHDKHSPCKACADACAKCAEACARVSKS